MQTIFNGIELCNIQLAFPIPYEYPVCSRGWSPCGGVNPSLATAMPYWLMRILAQPPTTT